MGLYDRDYGREYGEQTPWDRHQQPKQPKSVAIILIVINVGVFFLDMFMPQPGTLARWFAVRTATLVEPWTWFQLLTYGFVHDPNGINHILFNMIGLFFFGRAVEQRLGAAEFLRFYLVAIVIGGILGSLAFRLEGIPNGSIIGASGAVIATTILFACYYPNAEILLMFVLPVKAWVIAVLFVASDLAGALGLMGVVVPGSGNTAFSVHLSGAFFALLYYFRNWNLRWLNLGMLTGASEGLRQRTRRAKLKLHDPDKKLQQEADEADRILAKIHEQGESSLTSSERRTLQRYSRRQREKRRDE